MTACYIEARARRRRLVTALAESDPDRIGLVWAETRQQDRFEQLALACALLAKAAVCKSGNEMGFWAHETATGLFVRLGEDWWVQESPGDDRT